MENEMRLPWRYKPCFDDSELFKIVDCHGENICGLLWEPIARLIVASVNALKGWKVEQIEVVAEDGLEMFATWPDSQSNNERLVKANDTLTASNAKLREALERVVYMNGAIEWLNMNSDEDLGDEIEAVFAATIAENGGG